MNITKKKESTKAATDDFIAVRGKIMYASLFEPKPPAPGYEDQYATCWTTDLMIDSVTKAHLLEKGAKVRQNPKYEAFAKQSGFDGYDGSYITVKKPVTRKVWDAANQRVSTGPDGKPLIEPAPRPRVTDSADNDIPESAFKDGGFAIGNGTDAEVTFTLSNAMMRKTDRGCKLIRTKILNLVKYERTNPGTFVYGEEGDTAF